MANASAASEPIALRRRARTLTDRIGDPSLRGLSGLAALGGVALLVLLAYQVLDIASPAISRFGIGFVASPSWNPNTLQFGAAFFLYGTVVSGLGALLIATPLSIAIAIYLTEMAPYAIRRPVATLVDLLAAIPSVVLGLWGILVLSPFLSATIEPAIHGVLGWIPIFGNQYSSASLFIAITVLVIMTVPIVTSVTREIVATVPAELKEAAYALGATRHEMVRMVILPYARSGIVGAVILGLGRAMGEAIAVTQVIGDNSTFHASFFMPADTLASRVASEYQGAASSLQIASLSYLAVVLLVLSLIVNIIARLIVRRTAR